MPRFKPTFSERPLAAKAVAMGAAVGLHVAVLAAFMLMPKSEMEMPELAGEYIHYIDLADGGFPGAESEEIVEESALSDTVEQEPDVEADADTDTDTESETESEPELEQIPKPVPEPESELLPEPERWPDTIPEPMPDVVPEFAPVLETKPIPQPEPTPEPKLQPIAQPKPQPTLAAKAAPQSSASDVASTSAPSEAAPAASPQTGAPAAAENANKPRMVSSVDYLGRRPNPVYPRASERRREQGRVVVRVLISTSGTVVNASVASSSGFERLDEAALKAVRQARFRPYTENGIAYQALADIPFDFVL